VQKNLEVANARAPASFLTGVIQSLSGSLMQGHQAPSVCGDSRAQRAKASLHSIVRKRSTFYMFWYSFITFPSWL